MTKRNLDTRHGGEGEVMNREDLKQWLIDEFGFTYELSWDNGRLGPLEAHIGMYGLKRDAPIELTIKIGYETIYRVRIAKKRF